VWVDGGRMKECYKTEREKMAVTKERRFKSQERSKVHCEEDGEKN
jgi:hypothetical protein